MSKSTSSNTVPPDVILFCPNEIKIGQAKGERFNTHFVLPGKVPEVLFVLEIDLLALQVVDQHPLWHEKLGGELIRLNLLWIYSLRGKVIAKTDAICAINMNLNAFVED